jgi:hypothetical protein
MMDTKTVPAQRYFQQLRALGAWWRMGSSVLGPQLLVESIAEGSDLDVNQETERVSTPEMSPLRIA